MPVKITSRYRPSGRHAKWGEWRDDSSFDWWTSSPLLPLGTQYLTRMVQQAAGALSHTIGLSVIVIEWRWGSIGVSQYRIEHQEPTCS